MSAPPSRRMEKKYFVYGIMLFVIGYLIGFVMAQEVCINVAVGVIDNLGMREKLKNAASNYIQYLFQIYESNATIKSANSGFG